MERLYIDEDDYKMITDENGNSYDVQMYGKRSVSGIYFDARQVANMCNVGNLIQLILRNNNQFRKHIHFRKIGPYVLLTYIGLLRAVHMAKGKNAPKVKKWAIEMKKEILS